MRGWFGMCASMLTQPGAPPLPARAAGAYRNYGERLYVEGRLDAMRKEQMVGGVVGTVQGCRVQAARSAAVASAVARVAAVSGGTANNRVAARCRSCQLPACPLPPQPNQAARQREEEERAELEAYSFRPAISKLAKQIKASEAGLGASAAPYQRLYQRGSDCTAKRQVGAAGGRSATTAVRRCAGPMGARWAEGPLTWLHAKWELFVHPAWPGCWHCA